jgi:hypothetical protein
MLPGSQDTEVDPRDQAAILLARIAREHGASSALYVHCRDLWLRRERDARLSIHHGDLSNATAILERTLHVLRYGPEALVRDHLPVEQVIELMNGV